MMSVGSYPIAGLPDHGGRIHHNTDSHPNHDRNDQPHPGDHRASTRADGVGHVCLAFNWLNTRRRS